MADKDTEGEEFGGGFFDTFRTLPYPTLYGPMKTPVTVDVLEMGFLFAIGIMALSFFIIIPGVILKKRLIFFLKIVVGLFILISIFLCNFGQEWEVAETTATTQYKAGTRHHIHAEIGVKIGLRSVNITLRAHDENSTTVNLGGQEERIDYNERFSWDNQGWTQGRGGFGPFAGLINREFRDGQFRGVPYPILWIAEYFVPDGEGIRWGRYYRQAGYYTHIFMWLAFPLYILSVILIMIARSYGIAFFILTGITMLGGNFCFGFIRNPTDLKIPFEPHALVFHWGWCFWLCVATGLLNIFLGLLAFILDIACPEWFSDFLNVDMAKNYEEFYLSREELESLGIVVPKDSSSRYSKASSSGSRDRMDDEIHVLRKPMAMPDIWGTRRFRATERYRLMNNSREIEEDKLEINPGYKSRPQLAVDSFASPNRRPMPASSGESFRRPVIPQEGDRFEIRNSRMSKPIDEDRSLDKMVERHSYLDINNDEEMAERYKPNPLVPGYDNANLEESLKRLSQLPWIENDAGEIMDPDEFDMAPIPRPKVMDSGNHTKI